MIKKMDTFYTKFVGMRNLADAYPKVILTNIMMVFKRFYLD